jgi:hypothetical protein
MCLRRATNENEGAYDCKATMNYMKKTLAVSVALVAAVAVPATVVARPLTTTPGVIYVLKTPVDDKGVHVPKDKFTRNGISRYPRGALIRYEFINKGTKPYAVRMWTQETLVLKPGHKESLFLNWAYRGDYTYARIYKGHQLRPIGRVTIF